jgi:hypothetical protein
MPVTYNIDPVGKVIRTTCSSPLTFADVIGHFRTLKQDPACGGHLDVLLDLRTADLLPETNQFGAVTAELGALRDKVQFGTCAIVATRDAMFGMMRIFEVHAGPYFSATRVFRGMAEAEAWMVSQQSASAPEE